MGLYELHSRHLIYRDLKPENILLQNDMAFVKLGDFGFTKKVQPQDRTFTFCGTPEYMAPEVINYKAGYGPSVDWWALGVIVHYMLTLEEPLQHDTIVDLLRGSAERANKVTRARISLEIGAAARSLVGSLLSFDPSTRLGTVGGAAEVQAHPFFASVDWTKLRTLRLPPPLQTLVLPVAQPKF